MLSELHYNPNITKSFQVVLLCFKYCVQYLCYSYVIKVQHGNTVFRIIVCNILLVDSKNIHLGARQN